MSRTHPRGRVVGIDIIPAQPPKGVSTIQGNFLNPEVRAQVRAYVLDPELGQSHDAAKRPAEEEVHVLEQGYVDMERAALGDVSAAPPAEEVAGRKGLSTKQRDLQSGRVVDVVLSDMSEPWDQTAGFRHRSISDPYCRMMNTSGNAFKDHAGSMVGFSSVWRAVLMM
jgi:21S rRNA (uridine2791-2'-O)-methyltransferase